MEIHNSNEVIINFSTNELNELYEKILEIDFSDLFIEWMGPTIKKRFFETSKKTEIKSFISGLELELGLNSKKPNLKEAFKIYEFNALHSTDYMCMFRMYTIYFRDYEKFNVPQDQVKMMYFLCKSCAYLPVYTDNFFIFRVINPCQDINIIVEQLSNKWDTYDEFFQWFKANCKKYSFDKNELSFIELAPKYILGKITDYTSIKSLANKENPEIMLKLADSLYSTNKEYTLELLEQLVEMKYFRAYDLYANIIIMELEMYEDGAVKYYEGMLGGNFNCFESYYFAKLKLIDFSNETSIKTNLLQLLEILVNSLLFQDFFMIEEFFIVIHYLQKRGISIPSYYIDCVDDLASYLLSLENLRNEDLLAALGALYGFGISKIIAKDYDKALEFYEKIITIATEGQGRHRAAFGMMHSIKKKLFRQGKLTQSELDQFARRHLKATEANIEYYSLEKVGSSGTYFAARLRELIPEKKEELIQMFYYYEKSVRATNPTNVFQTNLRKEKSRKKLQEERMSCFQDNKDEILKNFVPKPKRVSKLANVECEICIERKISVVLAPCLHKLCKECYNCLPKKKCPFCRVLIERVIEM